MIDVVANRFEIDVVEILARLNTKPQLLVIVVQRVRELVDELGDVFLVSRVDLLPIDHYAGSLRAAQDGEHTFDKPILPFRGPVCEILNRFRLPGVAHEIR